MLCVHEHKASRSQVTFELYLKLNICLVFTIAACQAYMYIILIYYIYFEIFS